MSASHEETSEHEDGLANRPKDCQIPHNCTAEVCSLRKGNTMNKDIHHNSSIDRGWAWMIVLGSFIVCFFVVGTASNSFGIVMLEFQARFNASSSTTMGIGILQVALRNCLGPVSGILAIKITSRITVILGGLIMFSGYLLSIFADDLLYLYFTFGFLVGTGAGFAFTPALAMVGQYFRKRRAFASGLAMLGCGVGTFVANPLTRYLFDTYGSLSQPLLILSAIMLHVCVAGALYRPLVPDIRRRLDDVVKDKESKTVNNLSTTAAVDHEAPKSTTSVSCHHFTRLCDSKCCHDPHVPLDFTLLRNYVFLLYAGSIMIIYPVSQSSFFIIADYAKCLDIPKHQIVLLVSILGASDLVGRILIGFLADQNFTEKRFIFVGCASLCGIFSCIFPWITNFNGIAVLTSSLGFCTGGFFTLMPVIIAEKLGVEKLFSSLGLVTFCLGVSFLVTTFTTGVLKDATGEWTVSFLLLGILALIGSALLFLDSRAEKKENRKAQKFSVTSTL